MAWEGVGFLGRPYLLQQRAVLKDGPGRRRRCGGAGVATRRARAGDQLEDGLPHAPPLTMDRFFVHRSAAHAIVLHRVAVLLRQRRRPLKCTVQGSCCVAAAKLPLIKRASRDGRRPDAWEVRCPCRADSRLQLSHGMPPPRYGHPAVLHCRPLPDHRHRALSSLPVFPGLAKTPLPEPVCAWGKHLANSTREASVYCAQSHM